MCFVININFLIFIISQSRNWINITHLFQIFKTKSSVRTLLYIHLKSSCGVLIRQRLSRTQNSVKHGTHTIVGINQRTAIQILLIYYVNYHFLGVANIIKNASNFITRNIIIKIFITSADSSHVTAAKFSIFHSKITFKLDS